MDTSRDLLIIMLQIIIMKNAEANGWSVRRLNNKQIELTKTRKEYEKYNMFNDSLLCHKNYKNNYIELYN